MTTRKRSDAPPAHLSDEAKAIWRSVLDEYDMPEARHRAVLLVALEALMRMRQAQDAVEKDGAYIPDRWGGKKAHPALAVERDSRIAHLRAMRELGLDLSEAPSRPPSRWRS